MPDVDGSPVRVLIVEDHALFAEGLRMLLERSDEIEVVGIAGDGLDAIDLALLRDAQVVLMDVTLPRVDGLETTRRLHAIKPHARVIVVTSQSADEGRQAALDAGAVDFVTKSDVYDLLRDAVIRAAR